MRKKNQKKIQKKQKNGGNFGNKLYRYYFNNIYKNEI